MNISEAVIKFRKFFHLHKYTTRMIWIENLDGPGMSKTTIGEKCELCGVIKLCCGGEGKDTVLLFPSLHKRTRVNNKE